MVEVQRVLLRGRPASSLAICLAVFIPVEAWAASLSMTSDPGDYIGQGQTYFYTPVDGPFTVTRNADNGVSISFNTPSYSHFWYLDFAAPNSALLTPGVYSGATRYPFQASTEPGLSVAGDGRGCNTLTGSFEVKAVLYGTGTTITAFWATFEQHCEGAVPALRGEIRYNVPLSFYTLTPCRVLDTRDATGPLGGPALVGGAVRDFTLTGGDCGIPATASAVSVNVAAVGAAAPGYLTLYPSDAASPPLMSSVNFSAGQTRANNAIVTLAADGTGAIKVKNGSAGKVHLVVDVNGYFQ